MITPKEAYVATNGTVTLSCPADSISWARSHHGHLPAPVTSENGVILNGEKLIIESFQASKHAGSYYCIATTDNVTVVTCPTELIHACEC